MSSGTSRATMKAPQELAAEANTYTYNNKIPFRLYLRTLATMVHEANAYHRDGNHQKSYVLYLRYLDLVMNKLPKHPDISEHRDQHRKLMDMEVPVIFMQAEEAKKLVQKEYDLQKQLELETQQKMEKLRLESVREKEVKVDVPAPKPQFDEDTFRKNLAKLQRRSPSPDATYYPELPSITSTPERCSSPCLPPRKKLRSIYVPQGLVEAFKKYAHDNTMKNVETGGVICAKLIRDAFYVSHLVIPPQHSSCTSCETTDETKLLEVVEKEDVVVLGWIHTHPSRDCFLSSVDMHTQFGYQIMMEEAMAIVVSSDKVGIFRLTDPQGMSSIGECDSWETQHKHEDGLYTTCQVSFQSDLTITVVDCRQSASA